MEGALCFPAVWYFILFSSGSPPFSPLFPSPYLGNLADVQQLQALVHYYRSRESRRVVLWVEHG